MRIGHLLVAGSYDPERLYWVLTSCCGKWRRIERTDVDQFADTNHVTCAQVNATCAEPQDPAAFEGIEIHCSLDFPIDVCEVAGDYLREEVHAFEPCTKKKAKSDDEWFESGTIHFWRFWRGKTDI